MYVSKASPRLTNIDSSTMLAFKQQGSHNNSIPTVQIVTCVTCTGIKGPTFPVQVGTTPSITCYKPGEALITNLQNLLHVCG